MTTVLRAALPWLALAAAPAIAQAPAPAVTFAEHVAPIVFSRCARCHRPGEAAPFSLLSYEDVRRRGRLIVDVTGSGYMPPWHADSQMAGFRDDRRLTDEQIRTIASWVAGGMPRGDDARAPRPPRFTAGWQLGEPDVVVRMAEPFEIPPDGPDLFRNFAIPLELGADRWVRAIEFRPQGRASHHALFFFDGTGRARSLDESDPAPGFGGMSFLGGGAAARPAGAPRPGLFAATGAVNDAFGTLGGWAVGGTPAELPPGTARRLPATSDLVVQMHFHPSGKPETEQASIGIYFADGAPSRPLIGLQLPPAFGALSGIDIPPGEHRYLVRDWFILPIDVEVLSGAGHAHYLATEMRMTARPPGGETRELFSLPKWDFNWQERYYFAEPVRLPAGTRIDVVIAYDNSADNPANPFAPPQRVAWGRESTDEMGSMILEMLPVSEEDLPKYATAVVEHARNAALVRYMDRRVTEDLAPR
jgi:mono/diheme cytochrome c family protein